MPWMFKIYSVAFLFLAVGSFQLSVPHERTLFDYLDIPMSFIALAGFIGYAFEFPIGKPWFWKHFLFVIVGWDVLYNVVICYGMHLGQAWNPEPITIELLLANFVLFVPEYYAIYLFGQMDETDPDDENPSDKADYA